MKVRAKVCNWIPSRMKQLYPLMIIDAWQTFCIANRKGEHWQKGPQLLSAHDITKELYRKLVTLGYHKVGAREVSQRLMQESPKSFRTCWTTIRLEVIASSTMLLPITRYRVIITSLNQNCRLLFKACENTSPIIMTKLNMKFCYRNFALSDGVSAFLVSIKVSVGINRKHYFWSESFMRITCKLSFIAGENA